MEGRVGERFNSGGWSHTVFTKSHKVVALLHIGQGTVLGAEQSFARVSSTSPYAPRFV